MKALLDTIHNRLYKAYAPYQEDIAAEPSVNRASLAMRPIDSRTWPIASLMKWQLKTDFNNEA